MSLRFQRLIIILITLIIFAAALLLILFNVKQNIVFFYTPTELLENNISLKKQIRIGGYVKKNSYIPLHVNINNYGLSVDAHHIFMHAIMQYIVKSSSS